ncbi:MAG: hypothetical protein ABIV11_10605 [Gemmatimonadaceae bacterium]
MIPVLVSGVDPSVVAGLRLRLEGVSVDQVEGPREIAQSLAAKDYHLLLLGDAPGRALVLDVLRDLRQGGARIPLRIACCLDRKIEGDVSSRLLTDMAIDRIFFSACRP